MTARKAGLARLAEHPQLRGVAVWACADGDKWEDPRGYIAKNSELAHVHFDGKHAGWVCVRRTQDYTNTTIGHELAHLIVGHKVHNERWRRTMRSLGCRVERKYRRRPH